MSPKQKNKLTVLVKCFLDVIWFISLALAVIWPITVMVIGLGIPSDPEQRHTDIHVFLNFRINSNGSVSKVKIKTKKTRFSNKGVGCMASVLRLIDFPTPKGGGLVDVRQPLNFLAERERIN